MTRVWFLPSAVVDVRTAWAWYEEERAGLGDEFVAAVEAAVDRLLDSPLASPVVFRDARRFLPERFLYCLFYRVVGDGVVVIALLHAARDADVPEGRLPA